MLALLAQIEFEYPIRLVCLAVLPAIGYFAYRTALRGGRRRRMASAICRALVVSLAVVGFANPVWHWQSDQRYVLFVTDASRSVGEGPERAKAFVSEAVGHQGPHEAAFMAFAGQVGPIGRTPAASSEGLEPLASDPGSALRAALASLPAGYVPQIVLLTDGNQTAGRLAESALGADVPVSVVPLDAFPFDEVCMAELVAPARAARFVPTSVEVVVRSNHEEKGARIALLREGDDRPIAARAADLAPGENRLRFQVPANADQDVILRATVRASGDTIAENNSRRIRIRAAEPIAILLVGSPTPSADAVRRALTRPGWNVQRATPSQFADAVERLPACDLVVLCDVEPGSVDEKTAEALDRYVREQGGGLIALGGDKTFGRTAYRGSALERMLPVEAAEVVEAEKVILAMVLVIDKSGSMNEERRMELAKLAAKQSIQLLEPYDKAGVMAFSDDAVWVAPLAPCSDKPDLMRRIDTLEPKGETKMYPAVERAFLALEQTVADRRHMILLTDGIPFPGDHAEIAAQMARSGVTLSTVSISPGAEQDLLKKMASLAGGRHRHCDDPADVPKILVQETRAAASEEGLHDFRPFVLRRLPGLDVADSPTLGGYVATSPKPDAEPLLMAGPDPLLTWWRYGKGVSVALTSDAGRWRDWSGYRSFWQRLVRHAARRPEPDRFEVAVRRSRATGAVTVDLAQADLGSADQIAVSVEMVAPQRRPLEVRRVAPGRYRAEFAAEAAGEYQVQASLRDGSGAAASLRRSLFVDYADELDLHPTNEPLLRSVAAANGGEYDPEPAAIFAPDGRTASRQAPLWNWLVLAALVLFVVDVGIRRLRFAAGPVVQK